MAARKTRTKAKQDPIVINLASLEVALKPEYILDTLQEILEEMIVEIIYDRKWVDKKKINAIIKEVADSIDWENEVRKAAKENMIRAAMRQ